MAVDGDNYTALLDATTLLLVRAGIQTTLSVHITGEYALALSETGLLAIADFDGKTWFVRPGSDRLEMGPYRPSRPMTASASANYVAWGYADGSLTIVDTATDHVWEFTGHDNPVTSIVIDVTHSQVVSSAGPNLRFWSLRSNTFSRVADVPGNIFNISRSPDGRHLALDCGDGNLRVWTPGTNNVRTLHHHSNTAFSVAWFRNFACSGGFDGRVLCSTLNGETREVLSTPETVRWITASPDHQRLVIATAEGRIRDYDGALHELYKHDTRPYRMAFTTDGRFLASGAADGTVIVYDYDRHQVVNRTSAHRALVTNVIWQGRELWTASLDGTMKHWRFEDDTLTLLNGTMEPAFRFFHLLETGWAANVDTHFLFIEFDHPRETVRFDADRFIDRVEVSPLDRYVAATLDGETVVVDLQKKAVAALQIPSDGVGYVGFSDETTLIVSNGTALLMRPIEGLSFVGF